jgi:hypothetical protein
MQNSRIGRVKNWLPISVVVKRGQERRADI